MASQKTATKTMRKLLTESAHTVNEAEMLGLALYDDFSTHHGDAVFILYDPSAYLKHKRSVDKYLTKDGDAEALRSFNKDVHTLKSEIIVGGITIAAHHTYSTSWEVESVHAKEGWGPFMYDIAMSHVARLMSDRSGAVSSDARKIWAHYFFNRSDVKKALIDDQWTPKTPTKKDDGRTYNKGDPENPLNYVYTLKSLLDLSRLKENHRRHVKHVKSADAYQDSKSTEHSIKQLSRLNFYAKYDSDYTDSPAGRDSTLHFVPDKWHPKSA